MKPGPSLMADLLTVPVEALHHSKVDNQARRIADQVAERDERATRGRRSISAIYRGPRAEVSIEEAMRRERAASRRS